jgi:hypothetical protein
MSDTILHLSDALGTKETLTFATPYNAGDRVEVEITARQKSDPAATTAGIYVVWDVSRGLAEVNPVLSAIQHTARQQFVVIFEGRESPAGNAWYVCEASDVQSRNRHLMGTGKTPREAFENFCERAEVLLSESPAAVAQAQNYSADPLAVENMREQARRCFKRAD